MQSRVQLTARRLGKRFGPRWLFRNIELELFRGEALIVVGNNGTGKSTLLRLLAGLEPPTEGGIEKRCRSLGYCGLDQAVFPNLTVAEHLELCADLRGLPYPSDEEYRSFGLGDHQHHLAHQLSSGLRSRLRLMIALIGNPELLIWDEPGVALDEMGQQLVQTVINRQLSTGCLILATNDERERRYGTYVLDLN